MLINRKTAVETMIKQDFKKQYPVNPVDPVKKYILIVNGNIYGAEFEWSA